MEFFMKKVLAIIMCIFMTAGLCTGTVSAHSLAEETIFDFNDLTADENGVFINTDTNKYFVRSATPYVNDETPYNEVFVTDKGGGDKAITLKSTKSDNFGFQMKNFSQTGTVEMGVDLKVDDLDAVRQFGVYDCWYGGDRPFFVMTNGKYLYVCGESLPGNYTVAGGDILNCKFYLNLDSGYTHTVIKKNGNPFIDLVNQYAQLKNYIAANKELSSMYIYQRNYKGADLSPAVTHLDNFYIKPVNRFYDMLDRKYDFNDFAGSDDGYSIMPDDFTRAYGTPKTDASAPYEGVFAVPTGRGTSIKFESNVKRDGSTKDAPYIYTSADIKSTETGFLEFSVMRPEKSTALYINLGTYNKPLAVVTNKGNLQVFGYDTKINLLETDTWYDIKLRYKTDDLSAFVEVYRGGMLYDSKFIKQQSETSLAYKGVKGTDVTTIGFGLYLWDIINSEPRDVSYVIFDDLSFGKTEPMYIPSEEGFETFDIAYSSPYTGTTVPVGNDVNVTFNNKISRESFTSSSVTVNGNAVPDGSIIFSDDGFGISLKGVTDIPNAHYHIAFTNVSDISGKTLTDYIEFDTKPADLIMSDIEFYIGSGETKRIAAVTEPGEEIKASFKAGTNNGYTQKLMYLLAAYVEDSPLMVSVDMLSLEISGEVTEYTLSANIPDDGKNYSLKALRWDSNNSPLYAAAELRSINGLKAPVAIIKLDDMTTSGLSIFEKWQKYAESENISLSFGLLCQSFDRENADITVTDAQIEKLSAIGKSPSVEVWLHGYDHAGGSGVASEFRESKEEQRKTFQDCERVAGYAGITFGSLNPPFNELDKDTVALLNSEFTNFKSVMLISEDKPSYMNDETFVTLYSLNSLELNIGDGIDNKERVSTMDQFIEKYTQLAAAAEENGKNYIVFQGHPTQWNSNSEARFKSIINYLKSIGTVFMQPSEYVRVMGLK